MPYNATRPRIRYTVRLPSHEDIVHPTRESANHFVAFFLVLLLLFLVVVALSVCLAVEVLTDAGLCRGALRRWRRRRHRQRCARTRAYNQPVRFHVADDDVSVHPPTATGGFEYAAVHRASDLDYTIQSAAPSYHTVMAELPPRSSTPRDAAARAALARLHASPLQSSGSSRAALTFNASGTSSGRVSSAQSEPRSTLPRRASFGAGQRRRPDAARRSSLRASPVAAAADVADDLAPRQAVTPV